jgi:hypothetical protein
MRTIGYYRQCLMSLWVAWEMSTGQHAEWLFHTIEYCYRRIAQLEARQ